MSLATEPAGTRILRPMEAEVVGVRTLTPHLRRITVTGPGLDRFGYDGPDHLVRIFLAPEPGADLHLPDSEQWWPALQAMPEEIRPTVRNYTVRSLDTARREMEIDFVLHGDTGPASAWAGAAAIGDRIGVLSDGAEFAPPAGTAWQLLIGDDTALPAIAAALSSAAFPTIALIEVGSPACEIPISAPPEVSVTWLHRGEDAPGTSDVVLRTLRELALPTTQPYAFVAGESSMVTTVRRHLCSERGFAKEHVYFCGYWKNR